MSGFQNILALDTAMSGCSAAVVAAGGVEAVRCEAMPRGQAEHLVPFAQAVMAEAGIEYAALDAVLCTIGPGAFTGLRIGMSTARGFALSLDIPIFGITTMRALAMDFVQKNAGAACSVILETKRSDFYVQNFNAQGGTDGEAQALELEAIDLPADNVLIGDGSARFLKESGLENMRIDHSYILPDMLVCARTLQAGGGSGDVFAQDAAPVYLRGADVSLPKNKPRILRGF